MGGITPYYLKAKDNNNKNININNNYIYCAYFNDKAIHNEGCQNFYLLDNFESFENYKNYNIKEDDYIYIYYYKNKKCSLKLPKSEIIKKYNLIRIIHNGKKIKLLASKDISKNQSDQGVNILSELKKSKFFKEISNFFNIDFSSRNINLQLINNDKINFYFNIYFFPLVGLYNVGSTCFMNATLQCLLHISELGLYFLLEYQNDSKSLDKINHYSYSKGNISREYYKVVKDVYSSQTSIGPRKFKDIIGRYNLQFSLSEANDSKDLIIYLLQTFHEELNYFGDKIYNGPTNSQNQLNRVNSFYQFMISYNMTNFSIASKLFFGTYENKTRCYGCNNIFYSYQKFEFISFGVKNYQNKKFNIINGFENILKCSKLYGENQYYCQICKKLNDGEIMSTIHQPPIKLVINIDYGKDKIYKVESLEFDEIIDVTSYLSFNFGKRIQYQISGICTHLGVSGASGHYIAFCRNKVNGKWYNFNDSKMRECSKNELYIGNPYLFIYEQL